MKVLLLIPILLLVVHCASSPRYHSGGVRRTKPTYETPKKKDTPEKTSATLMTIKREKSVIMTSSYYGPNFHGKPTASGVTFDMYGKTAAHKELPLGTILNVTYLKTGKSVLVEVNDRGPFIAGRDLDLSYGAANKIGLVNDGVGKVKITIVKWGEGKQ